MSYSPSEIYINDFVIISGLPLGEGIGGFENKFETGNVNLFYSLNNKFSFSYIKNGKDKIIIKWGNSFFSIFSYKCNNQIIITPNYEHFLNLKLHLSINETGIQEFILFNTPLQNHTFHKEVKRLFNIDTLIIENNEIKFEKHNKENTENYSLGKTFQERIENIIPDIIGLKHGLFLSGGGESRINAAISHHYNLDKDFITWGHPKDKEFIIASRIAEKQKTPHISIRPDVYNLSYRDLLYKTGFLSNMQYSYRYAVLKTIFEKHKYDIIWTGWGDINGYPTMYQSTELFTDFYLSLYKGEKLYPKGWNHEWLASYKLKNNKFYDHITQSPTTETFFRIKQEELAPRIFGQLLAAESHLVPVFAPWFSPQIYYAVHQEEMYNTALIRNKKARTIWKGELYYRLLKDYCPSLNNIIHSKGYYPWMVQKKYGLVGLAIAAIMKKSIGHKQFPFDPVENKGFLKEELLNIAESNNTIFDKQEIAKIVSISDFWNGNDILEIFKIIQVSWFLK